jgi:hypothetical protein
VTEERALGPPSVTLDVLINEIARLPTEKFKLALQAVETQLARDHEFRMKQEENRILDAANARTHILFLRGLIAGFVLSVGMIAASVVVGLKGHVWLATSLSGPCLVMLAALFVLRKLDTKQLGIISRAQAGALARLRNVAADNPPS